MSPSRRPQHSLYYYIQSALDKSIGAHHAWQLGLLPHDGALQGHSAVHLAHDCYLDRAHKVLLPESPVKEA